MVYKDCIVQVYGVINEYVPEKVAQILDVSSSMPALGIVMRFEGGGSLHSLLHSGEGDRSGSVSTKVFVQELPLMEKIRLLTGIARGLAELHTVGVVHADIKPDNVLLSSDDPPEVRLADFGLSIMKEQQNAFQSTLQMTAHMRGTPIYCAPEMLTNPYAEEVDNKFARPSRKTDMYAYGVLAWEVMTQIKPFQDIASEMVLCAKVHQVSYIMC
jgi:serine/threonine protein kinase